MAKLINLLARLRGRTARLCFGGLLALLAFVLLQFGATQLALAQQPGSDFDHSSTGFVLNAQHQNVRCETCHVKGVFKGTPKTCEACHGWNNPRATLSVMPTKHIPTGNATCESCHQANMAQFVDATRAFNHAAVRSLTCVNCHSANNPHPDVRTNPSDATHQAVMAQGQACDKCHTTIEFTGPKIPTTHIPTAAVACTACHTTADYKAMPTVTNIHANAKPGVTCAQCHGDATTYPMLPVMVAPPVNHVGMNGQACEACHIAAGSNVHLPVVDGAKFSGSKFNHGGVSTGCATCHGPNITGSSFFGISSIVVMPDSSSPGPVSHFPTSAPCESCHVGSLPSGQIAAMASSTIPGTGFQQPQPSSGMVHTNMTGNCASCHDTNAQWVGMSLYPLAGYGGFQSRPQAAAGQFNVADQSHPMTGDCAQCHTGISFDPANVKKPANHIPTVALCSSCHKGADFSVMPAITDIHANAQSGVTCAQCHGNTTTYPMTPAIVAPPVGHIDQGSLGCDSCHVGTNSSLMLPVKNGANFANSAFSHTGTTKTCASCHGVNATSFYGVVPKNINNLSPAHMPVLSSVGCETCHGSAPSGLIPLAGASGSMTFAGGSFIHSAAAASCDTCHGQNVGSGSFAGSPNIVLMPASSSPGSTSHVPTAAACDACHKNTPAGMLPGNATKTVPGTGFQLPKPTTSDLHANSTASGCSSCHEGGMSWVGVDLYPRTATYTTGATTPYIGFQARPSSGGGGYSLVDAGHPIAGECSNCHSVAAGFASPSKPGNHIPTTALCAACHKDASYTVMPAIADIHANAQSGMTCAQCHANTTTYPMVPAIVVPPVGHIDQGSLGCDSCHVGTNSSLMLPVKNGANFANSAFSHTGATKTCASCHGASAASFYGVVPKNINNLSPAHMPVSAAVACEACHTNNVPSVLVPLSGASSGMTTFAGASYLHSASTASCATCHGQDISSGSFAGSPNIIVMPQTSATGPTAHIPTTAACDSCHKSTPSALLPGNATNTVPGSGFKLPAPTTANLHANATVACSSCHEAGMSWVGVDASLYPRTATYNAALTTPYIGFQTRPNAGGTGYSLADASHPAAGECSNCHSVTAGFASPSKPGNHIPTTAVCAACHKDASYTVMPSVTDIHANAMAGKTCADCHSNTTTYPMTPAIVAPPTGHVAMGTLGCESCHVGSNSSLILPVVNGANFGNSAFSHAAASTGCASCHGAAAPAIYGVVPKNIANLSPAHMPVLSTVACEVCHTNNVPSMLIPLSGAGSGMTTFAGSSYLHSGSTSTCATCHGQSVSGASFAGSPTIVVMPQSGVPGANAHVPTTAACDSCHKSTPSTLLPGNATRTVPGTGFQLPAPTTANLHANATVACSSCHEAGMSWVGVDASLYPRTASFNAALTTPYIGFQTRPNASGAGYSVADGSHPAAGECSSCHSVSAGFGAPTKPTGHIPTAAACSACHKVADYSVMPGTADIHANSQAGMTCAQCHSDATKYPMVPAIVVPPAGHIAMASLGCEGCHVGAGSSIAATPVPDGAHFSGSLFSHGGITTGCDSCHGANVTGSSFYGVVPKALSNLSPGHMPITSVQCETCHVNSIPSTLVPSAGMKTFAGGFFSHSGIKSGCDTCHGATVVASSFAGSPNIVLIPTGASAHIPAPNNASCEACHAGSTPSGLVAGNAVKTVPGTAFQSPAPTSAMVHSAVSGNCASCHGDAMSWLNMGLYPSSPAGYVQHATYTGFQTRPNAGGSYAVADASHPGAGLDCSQCHSSFTGFGPLSLPGGHIPVASGSVCGSCHTNFSSPPTSLTAIHANAPTPTTNCVQCHSVANAAQFTLINPMVTPSMDHVPMGSASCETCHVGSLSSIKGGTVKDGDKFSGSLFNHVGISTGCNACHGVTVDGTTYIGLPSIKVMSYTSTPPHMRVPGASSCENCHTNSIPVGQVGVGTAGMKTFAGAGFIHTGITTGCETCHGPSITPASFVGNPSIVVMPATASGGHIPSSTVCESCHLGSTPSALMAGSATKTTGPGTGFKVALPASSTIHANSDTTSCNVCHESGKDWISVATYTRGPSNTPSPGQLFTGFQTRPINGGGTYSVNDSGHVGLGVGDCSNCHTGFTGFGPPTVPVNHIPYLASASCANCHTVADFAVMPTNANIHKYAQSATTNCAQCHSAANADIYNQLAGMTNKPLVKPATNHIPMAALGCEACHVSSLTGLTTSTTSFAGSKYSHSGVTTGCNACHVSGTGPFQGTLSIIVMPPTSGPAASTQHLPTSTTCETCHLGTTPSTLVPAVSPNTAASSTFATPVPTAAMNHTGVTASCNACHEAGGSSTSDVWMNMAVYPITTTAPFKGFQVRPSTAGVFRVADAAHPTSGDCSACHTSFTDFASAVLPQYHIPTASVACTNCHTTSNYATMPSFTAIHANAPAGATTTNCVLCHSTTNAANYMQLAGMAGKLKFPPVGHVAMGSLGCESCHVGANSSITAALPVKNGAVFTNSAYSHSGVSSGCANCHGDGVTALSFLGQTPKPIPAGHVPNTGSVDCAACHTTAPSALIAYNGAGAVLANTFATTKYSHSGITASCQTCHAGGTSYLGITNMVALSNFPTHIPTTTKPDCASCHLSSTPSALVTWTLGAGPKVAPNTGFGLKSQAPTGPMIHAGVTSGCVNCHEAGMSWLEVDTSYYTRTPTVKTAGANYLGFNTRPYLNGTGYSINDGSHPTGTADCSNCHGNTTSFSVSAVPTNHIPYLATATCANCHTTINLVAGNADFSVMPTWTNIHKYAPSTSVNCAQCHSDTNALKYNAGGVVIKSPSGIAKHVPYGTVACETCHVGLSPVIDTSSFAGGKYSHTGVTTGCATCHGNGLAATNFTGISNLVAIPTTAAMGATSHIPYTAACEVCHAASTPSALLAVTGTPKALGVTGFRLPAPTGAMIHSGISSGCNACHDTNYVWIGVNLYPINPSVVTANANYNGFQTRPVAAPVTTSLGKFGITDSAHPGTGDCSQCHTSTTAFTGVAKPAGHMPTTAPACSTCHSATDYSVVGLMPLTALHTGVTSGAIVAATTANMLSKTCGTCHTVGTGGTSGTAPFTGCTTASVANCASPPAMSTYQPSTTGLHPVHVPIGTTAALTVDCNGCHAAVTAFSGVNMKNATMHTSVNGVAKVLCMSCHERGLAFYGVTNLKVRPSGHHTGQDCAGSGCHTYNGGFRALVKPVMRGALVAPDMGRIKPTTQTGKPTRGSLGNSFDHKGVAAGKCKDCHDGKSASGMPARHLMVSTSCDTCHRPTTWLPAQFNHNGITPNTCLACHNGMGASSKPAGHFMTSRSCDSCHKNMGWTPVNYQHLSPLYRASPDKLTCISCHDTNGEIIRRQARALTRTKPIPVGP